MLPQINTLHHQQREMGHKEDNGKSMMCALQYMIPKQRQFVLKCFHIVSGHTKTWSDIITTMVRHERGGSMLCIPYLGAFSQKTFVK